MIFGISHIYTFLTIHLYLIFLNILYTNAVINDLQKLYLFIYYTLQ
jgi:hypothetical protein